MLIISKSKEPENLPLDLEINYAIVRHVNFMEWQFVIKDIKHLIFYLTLFGQK